MIIRQDSGDRWLPVRIGSGPLDSGLKASGPCRTFPVREPGAVHVDASTAMGLAAGTGGPLGMHVWAELRAQSQPMH